MLSFNSQTNQPNFQGNLYKAGVKISERKFKQVAELFAQKTEGMPDMTLVTLRNNSDSDGRFYHTVEVMVNGNSVANIIAGTFKNMFNALSPKKMVAELINVYRTTNPQDPANILLAEINEVKRAKFINEFRRENLLALGKKDLIQKYDVLIEQNAQRLARLEKQYKRVRLKEIPSGTWCV